MDATMNHVIENALSFLRKAALKKNTKAKKPTTIKKKVTVNRRFQMVMKN